MANSEELALDMEELKQLKSIAKRPRVISLLSNEIGNLTKLSEESSSAQSPQKTYPVSAVKTPTLISSAPKASSNSRLSYSTLSSFSWDQENDNVKIYILLEGVDQTKVEADFNPTSFDIKLHGVEGKNYRCAVPKLNKEVVPEKCKVTVKPKRVVVTLVKASKGNWLDLYFKEDTFKPSMDKEKDPMAGIMDLMKNMYEEGDDEMKKTIAKAWSDARSGKTSDPLKNYS